MKCKDIKKLLYLLADGELDSIERKKILEHIVRCKKCHEEYNTILTMKKLVSSSIQLDDLEKMDISLKKNKIVNRRNLFMRRKAIAASIALLLTIGTFVPVNGQSLAGNIQEWVKSISFNTYETDYTISTDLNVKGSEYKTDNEDEGYHEIYSSISSITKNFDYNIKLPKYIPENYTFSKVDHYIFDNGMTNILGLSYSHPEINEGKPSLTIDYEFVKEDIPKREIRYSKGTKVKSLKINDYQACLHYKDLSESELVNVIGLDIMVDKGDFKMIRIGILLNQNELDKHLQMDIEKDLIKIAESILYK